MDVMQQGLMLTAYGLGGVFVSLIIFYLAVRLLAVLFPQKNER